MWLRRKLLQSWRQANWLTILLLPLSGLYYIVTRLRNAAYQFDLCKSYRAPVPVIVVGNITVGGTGKTPLVIYLVEFLRARGFTPGVISRGYAGDSDCYPLSVYMDTPVEQSGDEPALIVRRTGAAMVVGPDRKASIKHLLQEADVDIIVSDDGLQHLAMQRDIEICVVDQMPVDGNRYLLPAGSYRETSARLQSVDMLVSQYADSTVRSHTMRLEPGEPRPVNSSSRDDHWCSDDPIHAVAGIGNPERFFNTCRMLGLSIQEHAFADHRVYSRDDLDFGDEQRILMTEKDAVKCRDFVNQRLWYLPVDAKLDDVFDQQLLQLLNDRSSPVFN